jgi:hypothetical protein
MIYTGQFRNIKNRLYQVDITVSDGTTGASELLFSDDPFTIDVNSNDIIYEPLKLSNATCRIVTDSYNFNLYSPTAQGSKMVLKDVDNSKIVWTGYLTANMFNMGFEQKYETIELEAIDALSTLDNYKYEPVDLTTKKIKSFEDIIIHIIQKSNCYTKIYINENDFITGFEDQKIIDKLLIAEQNFFSDDNEPMTYKEVLTEILQFLNYTIVALGDELYILNYDYIKGGFINYHYYSTTNNWLNYTNGYTTLNHQYNVTSSSFKANGASIELAEVYNQVAIKTDVYTNASLIPEFFVDDNLTNITKLTGGTTNWFSSIPKTYGNKNYVFKYLKNDNYKTYNKTNGIWSELTELDYSTISTKEGAAFVRMANYENNVLLNSSVSFSDYVCLYRSGYVAPTGALPLQTWVDCTNNVVLKYATSDEGSYFYDDYYLIINGSAYWDSAVNVAYVDDSKKASTGDYYSSSYVLLYAKLKIGNKYWNGYQKYWTDYEMTFPIKFEYKDGHLYNNWKSILNEVDTTSFINEVGNKITIKKSDMLFGSIEFSLYEPSEIYKGGTCGAVWLKDFNIKLIKPTSEKKTETYRLYKNEINTAFVNEFSDMNFKICSDTNQGLNYSSVIQKIGSVYSYNNSIKTKALGIDQLQEKNIIQSYVNQYSTPAKKLNLTLANEFKPYSLLTVNDNQFVNEKFIVDGMSIDVKNDTNLLNIVSKK